MARVLGLTVPGAATPAPDAVAQNGPPAEMPDDLAAELDDLFSELKG